MSVLSGALLGAASGVGGALVAGAVVARRPKLAPRRRAITIGAAIAIYGVLRVTAGPTFRRWEVRNEVASLEADTPMLRVLFSAEPALRESFVHRLDSLVAAGASSEQARAGGVEFGRQIGITRLARYMAITSDSAAADFAGGFLELMVSLRDRDPIDCADLVFGRSRNSTRVALTLTAAQQAQMVAVMNTVFLAADAARPLVGIAERDSLLAIVRADVLRHHGAEALEDLGRAQALGWRTAEPGRTCDAVVNFYQAIGALPHPAGGRLVRGLLGNYQPADSSAGANRRS